AEEVEGTVSGGGKDQAERGGEEGRGSQESEVVAVDEVEAREEPVMEDQGEQEVGDGQQGAPGQAQPEDKDAPVRPAVPQGAGTKRAKEDEVGDGAGGNRVRAIHVPAPRRDRPAAPIRVLPPRRAASGRQGQVSMASVELGEEPSTHRQAMSAPDASDWRVAEAVELGNHRRAGTWEPAKLPAGRTAVSSRWIYKRKTNSEGQIVKYKARVVARGFSQKPGLDYEETHAPTPALTALRVFVAIAIRYSLVVHQMDVEAAFLNSEIDVELYMEPPEGFEMPKGCNTLRIRRGLYGFKQSARLWWKAAHEFIISMGFEQLATEWCIYVRKGKDGPTYLLLYVDDMLVAGPNQKEVDEVKSALKNKWRMTDLGPAAWVLGISMERMEHGVLLSQSAYIRPGERTQGVDAPARRVAHAEGKTFPPPATVPSPHRSNAEPTYEHWDVALRVVRYLLTTHTVGLWYPKNTAAPQLEGWVDADHAGDKDTRKSTTGYAFKVFGCLVSWGARRQDIVATSTVHAEYVAMSEAARENAYLRTLLNDMRQPCLQPTALHGDNEGALTLVKKPAFHQRTKHIEIRWHYIREAQEQGDVSVQPIRSAYQQADILTKSLPRHTHERHQRSLGLLQLKDVKDEGEQRISHGYSGPGTRRDGNTHTTPHHRQLPAPHLPEASISGPEKTERHHGPRRAENIRHGGHSRAGTRRGGDEQDLEDEEEVRE
ncbi:hypothetical protein A4X09_0g7660, partial [Tilletia walkeri]